MIGMGWPTLDIGFRKMVGSDELELVGVFVDELLEDWDVLGILYL